MKLLQINNVVNFKSTGTIVEQIGRTALRSGWESYVAWGRTARPSESTLIKIGNKFDIIQQGIETRLFDRHSMASKRATVKLINSIKAIKPNIIHLHNLHAYYINIKVLFDYLSNVDIPVVWTLHDCWPFTGHCSHFEYVECEKWKTECNKCPLKTDYPASTFADRSRKNFYFKKNLFTSVKNLTIVSVSDWQKNLLKDSFLSVYDVKVINNGIDLSVFKPENCETDIRSKFKIGNRFMILGVATSWSNYKGLQEFIDISQTEEWVVVLIGLSEAMIKRMPKNIIALTRTENQQELASFYSAADVFVNPTYLDSFPTVNLEALACGTPVITYRTGGSAESVTHETGFVIERGDYNNLYEAIKIVKGNGKLYYSKFCRYSALSKYNKDDRFQDYLKLYNSLLSSK